MIGRILVPLDGSKLAEAVLPEVKELARGLHARIHLVRIVDVTVPAELRLYGTAAVGLEEEMEQRSAEVSKKAVDYLSEVARWLHAEGLSVSWETVEGRAAETIVELAHSVSADLVAMTTHGRTGLDRAISGSVAEEVMRKVEIPVLLVKPQ